MRHKEDSYLKISLLALFLFGLFLLGFFESKKSKSVKLFTETKFYLGSFVELKFYCNDEEKAKKVADKVFAEMERLDKKYSLFSNDSYLTKLNNSSEKIKSIDDETFYLLKLCSEAYQITDKKFDPSIGRITKYWNELIAKQNESSSQSSEDRKDYQTKKKTIEKIIDDELLKNLQDNSGWEKVTLFNDKKIALQNLWLTFDGILQGYAADRAISILKSKGIKKALVNVGGEIKVIGENWKIGIKHPRKQDELIEKLNVSNLAIATSGDYEKYFELNGKRYHHLIDPETAYPSNKNMSVTVIAENCALADALSTGFFSLEPDTILNIVKKLPDVEVYIVDIQGKIYKSNNFEKLAWR